MTDQQRIAEITARCEAATPGPWEYFDNGFDGKIRSTTARSKYTGAPKIICGGEPCEGRIDNCPDAHFIAHAREDIPYLLDLLAEREKGMEWEKRETSGGLLAICPKCNYPVSWWHKTPFCGNCGRKLDGGGQDARKGRGGKAGWIG